MHASSFTNSLVAVLALWNNAVSAIAVPRADSDLTPWVSVDASGLPVATITPLVTSTNGVATTMSAAPAELTATTTSQTDKKPTVTPGAPAPTSTGGGSFQVCQNMDGNYAPFCKPENGSSVYIGETYYVNWDTHFFAMKNASVLVQANYVNATGPDGITGGIQAYQSPPTANAFGFIAWTIDSVWLKGMKANNVTLFIVPLNPIANEPTSFQGPTLEVTNRPKEYYHPGKPKKPKAQDIYIALPTVFGFIMLCVVGGYFWNRNQRKIGLGNIMGRRKGYGVGKSRSQRLGLGKKKSGAIRLQERDLSAGTQYRDTPQRRAAGHARADSESLGSLVGTPTEDRDGYFTDEMNPQARARR
ncbi:hypothetical protein HYALB_00008957 [Hymenoscyphus albidus]|uniref:Uncharacterized protein n=1 Tax=Hymenoscyphus albidus TaxID=595503 RepID=A0A9N9LJX5_9HELO|nr:hypothetical protein HYALB_00008957 [Hymenoscyphus albidus]